MMPRRLAALLAVAVLLGAAAPARAQSLSDAFRKAAPSVVVVRAKGRDVGLSGVTLRCLPTDEEAIQAATRDLLRGASGRVGCLCRSEPLARSSSNGCAGTSRFNIWIR